MNTIIWTDLETGGLRPETADTTQIAAILDVGGQVREEINIFLRPDPKRVEAGALAVQKKTLEQVLSHPLSQAEGYASFRATLDKWVPAGSPKVSLGGQNVSFDFGFLKALFAAHGDPGGLSRYFDGSTVDTRFVADDLRGRGILKIANSKLGTICSALNVELGAGAHDALADIRATRLSFYEMRKRIPAAA